jgi:hypothetical protein
MPAKKANLEIHTNQRLSGAIALGALHVPRRMFLRTAATVLCISQSPLTILT